MKLLVVAVLTCIYSQAKAAEINVFILHSYHQQYPWTSLENEGITATLNSRFAGSDISYSTEYLDTKRVNFSDDYQVFFKDYLITKYKRFKPDIIFLTDDNALMFYLRYSYELFKDVPAVFCGVNNTAIGPALKGSNIRGVYEVKNIEANLTLIRKLLPDIQRVFIIGDNSVTYQAIKDNIQSRSAQLSSRLELEFIAESNFSRVSESLKKQEKGVMLLTTIGGFHDEQGDTLSISQVIEGLRESGDFIILSMEDVYMLDGVLGGIVTSGIAQGAAAAEKGIAILAGEKIGETEYFGIGPNIPTFDYNQLVRLGIPLSSLPADAEILNKPLSLFEEFREIFITALIAFAIMLVLLIFLSISVIRRKKAESALLASENFLSSVLDNLPDMVFVKDADGLRFVRLNRAGEELFGEKQENILGKTDYDFFPRHEADFFTQKDRQTLQNKVLVNIPSEPIHTDHGVRYLHTKKIPIFDENDNATYLLGISRDITDEKEVEKQRRDLEEKLRQAQKMESIGTLAGGIAHDFNNILSSIIGYTELAQRQSTQPEVVTQLLSGTLKGAERAKQLVRQILTFSRKGEGTRKPIVLADVIKEGVALLRSTLPSTISISEDITSNSRVLADPTQIQQIIMNLGTNGYQAMLDTGGTLVVTLDEVAIDAQDSSQVTTMRSGMYLHLSIQDTGRGMNKETLERMFDPYFTTKGPEAGTGLGLAVVHGIVKNYGGYISVISEVNIGTTVDIYLPVTDESTGESADVETKGDVQGGTESILLVDDEKDLIEMTERSLQSYGYTVNSFTSSLDALAEFRKNWKGYDLVITDMTMPHLTGTELAKELLDINPDIPIILCTGHSDNVDRPTALSMGIGAYCEKPMNIDEILLTIRRILDS